MRKLASIQEILEINDIEGADNIQVATVLGWQCVIKRDEFKVGDKIVFCEIDSLFPSDDERFSFLERVKYRIKTIKLRGQISQGLILPLSFLSDDLSKNGVELDQNVTEDLRITKYEKPIFNGGNGGFISGYTKGNFPSFLKKTDETRIQTFIETINNKIDKENLIDLFCEIREKLDGTSVTYYIRDGEFGVCSRNLEIKESEESIYWKMAKKYNIEEILRSQDRNIAIQGEIIGVGIQGNKYKLTDNQLFIFNLFDIDSYKYLNPSELYDFCKENQLNQCPFIANVFLNNNIKDWINFSSFKSKLNGITIAEGIVVRLLNDSEFSFKVINPQFLLKNDE